MVKAILTDIEGTLGSVSFVKNTLFPYAKGRLSDFVAEHAHDPEIARILDMARSEARKPKATDEQMVETLQGWIDEDRKLTSLKRLQGHIWEDGYRSGRLRGHVYPDAHRRLRQWAEEDGLGLYVFSSGSVKAQELYFEYSVFGDMRPLFKGYFDTTTGQKNEQAAYRRIAAKMGLSPGLILYLSDSREELDAARETGFRTYWVVREGRFKDDQHHPQAANFDEVDLG